MLNPIAAHVKFIQRNDIFGKIISDMIIRSEFTLDCFIRSEQIGDLNIQLLISFVTDKINFFLTISSNCDLISATKEFHVHDIL